ncbi:Microcystin degradation protein MlrC, contains DUF1485 domain [Faunimonas pinastri]|uniref:Microcystin degradation protein MlrC, contains DUF1485 domain n=1 Tax=Faunimonas pinastri TaxID=1855383 RepID=A0A1H9DYC4_9HYPH|nr:M81 family metallopeptidase [Faunimonas pinastri]SEQ18464.1 Microcystin degradation protein MlrC, contains DUF1485 domain [Faunimonas pinastri]
MSLRIAIVGLSVEALIRSPLKSDTSNMQTYRGQELPDGNLWLVRGILERLGEDAEVEAVPLIWSTALPGGSLTKANYDAIKDETVQLLKEHGPFDGVAVANHGALEVDEIKIHADGDFVMAVRGAVGPDVPLAVALDLHGHFSPELLNAATVFSALRTAPHRDDRQTGYRAADQLMRVLKQGLRPTTAAVHIPVLVAGELAVTTAEPGRSLYAGLAGIDREDGVVEANILVGFAFNDRPWTGMTAIVTSDGDASVARDKAQALARTIWSRRREFRLDMEAADIETGLRAAAASEIRPVYVSDSGDNTTAGAPGDLTEVLQAAIELDEVTDAVVAGITAPETVRKCLAAGIGARLEIELGAEHISGSQKRMTVSGIVEAGAVELTLGGFQPYRSAEGGWVRVRFGNVVATFHDLPIGITTPAHFLAMGIDPTKHALYVVKLGYLHPQIEDIAKRHIMLLSDGTVPLDITRLPWSHAARPAYPLDPDGEWTPEFSTFVQA